MDWVIIGDVSGHGVPAGLVMIMVQTCIHHTLNTNPGLSPAKLLELVNITITKNIELMDDFKYMTITIFVTDGNGKFTFAGLHQDILIDRSKTEKVEAIPTTGYWRHESAFEAYSEDSPRRRHRDNDTQGLCGKQTFSSRSILISKLNLNLQHNFPILHQTGNFSRLSVYSSESKGRCRRQNQLG